MTSDTAIILAAGMGTRLAPSGAPHPKTLSVVAGRPLLGRIMEELSEAGVKRFVIVIGHLGKCIQEFVAGTPWAGATTFVEATDYASTNNSMSLLVAGEWLERGAWIVEADVIVEPGTIKELPRTKGSFWVVAPFGEELDGCCLSSNAAGRIETLSIRRRPFTGPPPGEWKSVGVVHVTETLGAALRQHLQTFESSGRTGEYYDLALRDLLADHVLSAASVGQRFWAEIDTADELAAVEAQFAQFSQ